MHVFSSVHIFHHFRDLVTLHISQGDPHIWLTGTFAQLYLFSGNERVRLMSSHTASETSANFLISGGHCYCILALWFARFLEENAVKQN
jgi:hypothetical protein